MKKIAVLIFTLAFILLFTGCAADTVTLDIGKASRLEIVSAAAGETAELCSAYDISRISDNINSLEFTEVGEPDSDDWAFALIWIAADGSISEKLTVLADGRTVIYEDSAYTVRSVGGSIDLNFIESAFSAVN